MKDWLQKMVKSAKMMHHFTGYVLYRGFKNQQKNGDGDKNGIYKLSFIKFRD